MIATTCFELKAILEDQKHYTHFAATNNGHDNLTPRITITSNVARELLHVGNKLSFLTFRCSAAYAFPERNRLASHLTLEGAEDELIWTRWIRDIEPGPIHSIAR